MRYDAEHKQRTHEKLVKEAARSIRREGPHKVSVAAIMGKVGLTHGGFYAHFASRDELIAEGIAHARESAARLSQSLEGKTPAQALADYVDFYLSAAHRDARTSGCPLPFLSADVLRLPAPARARFAEGVQAMEARLGGLLSALGREAGGGRGRVAGRGAGGRPGASPRRARRRSGRDDAAAVPGAGADEVRRRALAAGPARPATTSAGTRRAQASTIPRSERPANRRGR